MKMFLASYRFGDHVEKFLALTGTPGRVAVIASAADGWPSAARQSAVTTEVRDLRALGFDPYELDLRSFIDRPEQLAKELDRYGTVWVRGGNTFVLRAQLRRSGADFAIARRVREGTLTYGGYSAGACVVSTTLRGIEAADDPDEVLPATGTEVVWNGLGLIDFAIVPHFGSILDDNGSGPKMVSQYQRENIPYRTLTDEQVVVIDGELPILL
ncbi:Type 1 glutamine amidotransferase-like domain-containing protein [Rhodococcus sp. BP22]|uniref:Type 1 glutamine amidotransferase-like domain-containing protein n=1 Tax=Rhodococcus sp. BP22 TaxID=2758566 RepID=UPI001647ECA7|nr:Type 1 glutamine amidotransferase-like domain-containing protein [Rhodococcus sp. BP22]